MKNLLNKVFKLDTANTTIGKEIYGGVITFFAMCYILFLNPIILKEVDVSSKEVFSATAICAIVACLIMAFVGNKPLGIAPGMGLNSIFAVTICSINGFSFEEALSVCFLAGILYLILTLTGFRNKIIEVIPDFLKKAISTGIGLFIATVGLIGADIIVSSGDSTIVKLGSLNNPVLWIALFGLLLLMILNTLHVKGSIIISIIGSTLFGIILTLCGLNTGMSFKGVVELPVAPNVTGFIKGFGSFTGSDTLKILTSMFSICFLAMFNVTGTVSATEDLIDLHEPKARKRVLLADSLAYLSSSMLGATPSTIFGETMSGIDAGAKTGLANVVTALLFLLALFFSPLLSVITEPVTSAVLIMIGVMLMQNSLSIKWSDYVEGIPAFLTIFLMPLTSSIINGIAFGLISYVILKSVTYRKKEGTSYFKELPPILFVLVILFIINFVINSL